MNPILILVCVTLYLTLGVFMSMIWIRNGLRDIADQNTGSLYTKLFTRTDPNGKYVPNGYGMIFGTVFWVPLAIIFGVCKLFWR